MTKQGVGLDDIVLIGKKPVREQESEKPVLIGISGGHQVLRINGQIVIQ